MSKIIEITDRRKIREFIMIGHGADAYAALEDAKAAAGPGGLIAGKKDVLELFYLPDRIPTREAAMADAYAALEFGMEQVTKSPRAKTDSEQVVGICRDPTKDEWIFVGIHYAD